MKKGLVIIGAIVLIILFFSPWATAQTKEGTEYFSAFRIATDNEMITAEGRLAFIFLIIPVILLVLALMEKSYLVLRNVSIAGAASVLIWIVGFGNTFSSIEFSAWLTLILYVGLTIFTQFFYNKIDG
jgi:hypothetical protein